MTVPCRISSPESLHFVAKVKFDGSEFSNRSSCKLKCDNFYHLLHWVVVSKIGGIGPYLHLIVRETRPVVVRFRSGPVRKPTDPDTAPILALQGFPIEPIAA